MKKNKSTKLGRALIQGLQEAVHWNEEKLNLRTSELSLPDDPPDIDKKIIKKIREDLLKMSQPIFAKYLGVSDKAVKAWEQGISKPNGSAIRLLQIALSHPQHFNEMIVNAAKKGA